jgi:uncharacterized protein with HEPN domain
MFPAMRPHSRGPIEAARRLRELEEGHTTIRTIHGRPNLRRLPASDMTRAAVERKFEIIGEALVRFRTKDPETFARISASQQVPSLQHLKSE